MEGTFDREEAIKLLKKGYKIRHKYYSDNEYIYMKDGIIYSEEDYDMGGLDGEFWTKYQTFQDGWELY